MGSKKKKNIISLQNKTNVSKLPVQQANNKTTELQFICPMPSSMIPVNITEYNNLQKENIELKIKVSELTKHKNDLMELITQKDRTIDELKKENAELKIKIEHLENEVKDIKQKHNDLENKFNKMIYKQKFEKYMVAIQDLNNLEQLEEKLDLQTKKRLYQLKSNRIYECHYLDNLDSQNLIDDKRTVLYDKIINMENDVKNIFNKKFPNLLNSIIPYIIKTKTTPSQQTIDDINEWWDY